VEQNNTKKFLRATLILVCVLVGINLLTAYFNIQKKDDSATVNKDYVVFLAEVADNKVSAITLQENRDGTRNLNITKTDGTKYDLVSPKDDQLISQLVEKNISLETIPPEKPNMFMSFLISWGPMLLFIAVWIFFMKKMSGGSKGLFTFNKNKAKLIDPDNIKETFDDVVGCDEAKYEVKEFVEFLKNPEKFSKLGGKTPRGVLFSGPSGTGKTLLAKALAKESGVPFFAISGSDFVEMFVGVGAGRVRDMFETAKKAAPCVLFIDEIDAIGGKRGGGGIGGGHDEREQTLNQILVELDGMEENKGVILVAATNRPETLDPALMRPGRIDRQITVGLPDVAGREQILKIHSKNTPMSFNVDLKKIARGTPGFSGAELKNLINEAAIYAARRDKRFVDQKDLEDAKDKIMLGVERPSLAMTEQDKRETAYHESGHAIIAKLLKGSDPIYKVTIIPRGRALGVTIQLPEKDRFSYKQEYLRDRIAILMGGRAAEEIFCNTFTSGASNDISVATSTARSMIMRLGMSKLGPIAFGEEGGGGYFGQGSINTSFLAQKTLEKVDAEVQKIIQEQYDLAFKLLSQHHDKVEAMTNALMEVETLDDWQVENIMQGRHYNDNDGFIEFKSLADEKSRIAEADLEARRKEAQDKAEQKPADKTDDLATS